MTEKTELETVKDVIDSMPNGMDGFLKTWGLQQFGLSMLHAAVDYGMLKSGVEGTRMRDLWRKEALINIGISMLSPASPALPAVKHEPPPMPQCKPAKADIKELVNRFLAWPLPQTVAADGCATDSSYQFARSGTNLLNAAEAEAMLRHVLSIGDGDEKAV